MQRIEYPKWSKVIIEDGVILIEPDEKWEPKIGEIVRIRIGKDLFIGFYTNKRGSCVTTSIGIGGLAINTIAMHGDVTVYPTSQKDKTRLLTALADAGYQYNEETHEVEMVRWKPKKFESYFSFNAVGVFKATNVGAEWNLNEINNGLAFQTEAKAQEFFDQVKELAKKR